MLSATAPVRGSLPPEEKFWQRYSPHHEFSLSSASSVAIHILALIMVLLVGRLVYGMMSDTKTPLIEVPVTIEPPGGGGGNPLGVGNAPGGPVDNQQIEDVRDPKPARENANIPENKRPRLDNLPPLVPPANKDDGDRELFENAKKTLEQASRIHQETLKQLRNNFGKGVRGPGSGGGADKGKDTGTGDKEGPGTGQERLERMDRWVLVFDTYSGEDYARQLHALGAILAIPRENKQYAIIRDLGKRPAVAELGDITAIQRIWWEDNKHESIGPLCSALASSRPPIMWSRFSPSPWREGSSKLSCSIRDCSNIKSSRRASRSAKRRPVMSQ